MVICFFIGVNYQVRHLYLKVVMNSVTLNGVTKRSKDEVEAHQHLRRNADGNVIYNKGLGFSNVVSLVETLIYLPRNSYPK
jgi:hypothetical protein